MHTNLQQCLLDFLQKGNKPFLSMGELIPGNQLALLVPSPGRPLRGSFQAGS